jgi:hypothetical protein
LTIKEENDKKIQHMRSRFLFNNIDIDYTTMGITNIINIFKKYLGDNKQLAYV